MSPAHPSQPQDPPALFHGVVGGGAGLATQVPQLIHRPDSPAHTHESSRLPSERRRSLHPPRQAVDRDRHAILRPVEGGYSILGTQSCRYCCYEGETGIEIRKKIILVHRTSDHVRFTCPPIFPLVKKSCIDQCITTSFARTNGLALFRTLLNMLMNRYNVENDG